MKGCRFVPHVSLIQTNQRVRIVSDDAIGHLAHPYDIRNKHSSLIPKPPGEDQVTVFRKPELIPVKVGCDIHPWMAARWLILDHPYAAVTGDNGEFEIKNLPVGCHQLRIWHEKVGFLDKTFKVTVAEGVNNKLESIEVRAETLMKK